MPRDFCRLFPLLMLAMAAVVSLPAANVTVVVDPTGATVTSETGQRLTAPATFEVKRRKEPYAFTVEKPGYQTETVYYEYNYRVKQIQARLEPLQVAKSVTISSDPEGATVTIDGMQAGKTPLTTEATFHRDSKTSPWKPVAVTVAKADYQGESFTIPFDKLAPAPVALAQLRKERVFLVEAKAGDGTPIQATVSLDGKAVGPAPQKITVVFSRADKSKAWPEFSLKAEIPTIYEPSTVALTHDRAANVSLTLSPVTELPVARYGSLVKVTATGVKMMVDEDPHVALLESGERNADISGLARLTRYERHDQNPKAPLQALNSYAITPDGSSAILAVTSQDEQGKYYSALFLKKVEDDGGGLARLIDNNRRYFDSAPIIAPDSSNILVFQSNRSDLDKPDIFRVNFAESGTSGGVARITNDSRYNYGPSYTDSNREVVFLSVEPNYPLAKPLLSTAKLDGALPTQFQINAEEVSHREHTKIYFTRVDESTGKKQIFSVDPDGRLETHLVPEGTFLNANCFNPVASFASPARVLFVSDRDADEKGRLNNNIYVMNADGTQVQRLTGNGSDDILPAWSPTDPNVVYFLSNRGGAYNLWRFRLK